MSRCEESVPYVQKNSAFRNCGVADIGSTLFVCKQIVIDPHQVSVHSPGFSPDTLANSDIHAIVGRGDRPNSAPQSRTAALTIQRRTNNYPQVKDDDDESILSLGLPRDQSIDNKLDPVAVIAHAVDNDAAFQMTADRVCRLERAVSRLQHQIEKVQRQQALLSSFIGLYCAVRMALWLFGSDK